MKILYITNINEIYKASGGWISDYLNDLIFYGLHEILNTDVVDSTKIIHLYKENEGKINKQLLWGGFSAFYLIDNDNKDRDNIEEKIKDKYYDFIIYGNCQRCLDYYDLVTKVYDNNKVVMLDGNDEVNIHPLSDKHLYFKRENYTKGSKNILPISFSMPKSKIRGKDSLLNKTFDFATVVPGVKETYIFNNEKDYYDDYAMSYFGITHKKAGWDCMRHYEVLGNYCVPYFPDISQCPENIMVSWNKKLQIELNKLVDDTFHEEKYFRLLDEMFDWFINNNTTENEAKTLLEKIV
jgi:hypothetical protein